MVVLRRASVKHPGPDTTAQFFSRRFLYNLATVLEPVAQKALIVVRADGGRVTGRITPIRARSMAALDAGRTPEHRVKRPAVELRLARRICVLVE